MKNLPTPIKWLIVFAAIGLSAALLYYTNFRSGQVDMPAPDWGFTVTALLARFH